VICDKLDYISIVTVYKIPCIFTLVMYLLCVAAIQLSFISSDDSSYFVLYLYLTLMFLHLSTKRAFYKYNDMCVIKY
jgi:hypothetical protein